MIDGGKRLPLVEHSAIRREVHGSLAVRKVMERSNAEIAGLEAICGPPDECRHMRMPMQ